MLTGTQVADIYSTLRNDFQKGIEEAKPISGPLYETVSSGGESNVYGWFDHVPGFRRWWPETQRAKRNLNKRTYRVPNRDYEDTIAINENKINDDQLVQFRPAVNNMGKAGVLLEDELVFDLLNYGFTGTNADGDDVKCYDELAWFSASHVVGETTINNLATGALAVATYKTAYETLLGYKAQADKDSTARPLNPQFTPMLVVPPTLLGTALGIVNALLTTAGASNVWYKTAEILSSPYLTSTTAWFLINVGGPSKPIFFQDREKLSMQEFTPQGDQTSFMSNEVVVGGKRRCSALVTFPWLAYGSTGAG